MLFFPRIVYEDVVWEKQHGLNYRILPQALTSYKPPCKASIYVHGSDDVLQAQKLWHRIVFLTVLPLLLTCLKWDRKGHVILRSHNCRF